MVAEMTSGLKVRVVARTLARPLISVITLVEEFRRVEGLKVEELVEEMVKEGLITLEKLPCGLVVRPSLRSLREEEAREEGKARREGSTCREVARIHAFLLKKHESPLIIPPAVFRSLS